MTKAEHTLDNFLHMQGWQPEAATDQRISNLLSRIEGRLALAYAEVDELDDELLA